MLNNFVYLNLCYEHIISPFTFSLPASGKCCLLLKVFCKQFRSGSKLFDALMLFRKNIMKKGNFQNFAADLADLK